MNLLGTLRREMLALSSRGGVISAVLIFVLAIFFGFQWAKNIYQDHANHWQELYEKTQTRRGLSDKALKMQAMEVADLLSEFVAKEREASALMVASHSVVNTF